MQTVKEEMRTRILEAARKEFLARGFEKASIRKITAEAQTSKSNLYNYFCDKDALFCAVVGPVTAGVQKGLLLLKERNSAENIQPYTMEAQKEVIIASMKYVFENADDFRLLLFHSEGSSMADFRSRLVESFADVMAGWFSELMPERPLSGFFIRCVVNFYVSTIEQLLAEGVSPEQAGARMEEFLKFVYGGWRSVMQ